MHSIGTRGRKNERNHSKKYFKTFVFWFSNFLRIHNTLLRLLLNPLRSPAIFSGDIWQKKKTCKKIRCSNVSWKSKLDYHSTCLRALPNYSSIICSQSTNFYRYTLREQSIATTISNRWVIQLSLIHI